MFTRRSVSRSDGFFDIKEQPKKVAVVGAGYIAVELAGIFHALGTEAHLFIRKERAMRSLDPLLSDTLDLEVRGSWVYHPGCPAVNGGVVGVGGDGGVDWRSQYMRRNMPTQRAHARLCSFAEMDRLTSAAVVSWQMVSWQMRGKSHVRDFFLLFSPGKLVVVFCPPRERLFHGQPAITRGPCSLETRLRIHTRTHTRAHVHTHTPSRALVKFCAATAVATPDGARRPRRAQELRDGEGDEGRGNREADPAQQERRGARRLRRHPHGHR